MNTHDDDYLDIEDYRNDEVSAERFLAQARGDDTLKALNSDIDTLDFVCKMLFPAKCEEIVRRLLDRFGSAIEVFEATYAELMRIDGMTDRAATLVSRFRTVGRQAILRTSNPIRTEDTRRLAEFTAVYFLNTHIARGIGIFYNDNYEIISVLALKTDDRLREVVAEIGATDAKKVALASYQPYLNISGGLSSAEMRGFIKRLSRICEIIEVDFVDYVEFCGKNFFSLFAAIRGRDKVENVADSVPIPYEPNGCTIRAISKLYPERKH